MKNIDTQSRWSNPVLAAVLATFCAVLWGSAYPGIKSGYELFAVGTDDTAAKMMFAGVRFALAGAFVLILRALIPSMRSKTPPRVQGVSFARKFAMVFTLGLAQTALQYFFFYVGLSYTTGAKGSIMNSTTVFFSALLAHFVYKNDKLDIQKASGILIGFLGVILVNWQRGMGFDFSITGEGFVVIAAFVLSSSGLYSKWITDRMEPVFVSGCQLMIGGLILIVLAFSMGASFIVGGISAWLVLLYLAVLSSVAFTLWTLLLKFNKVSFISVFNFFIPVVGTVLSALILKESVWQIQYYIAVPAVAIGIFLVNSGSFKTKK